MARDVTPSQSLLTMKSTEGAAALLALECSLPEQPPEFCDVLIGSGAAPRPS